jgi:hypothetical protein
MTNASTAKAPSGPESGYARRNAAAAARNSNAAKYRIASIAWAYSQWRRSVDQLSGRL